jgi:hypothetical protein
MQSAREILRSGTKQQVRHIETRRRSGRGARHIRRGTPRGLAASADNLKRVNRQGSTHTTGAGGERVAN